MDADDDPQACPRCGDPLPLDRQCDCVGDPDRDRIVGLRGLETNRVLTIHGMKRVVVGHNRE